MDKLSRKNQEEILKETKKKEKKAKKSKKDKKNIKTKKEIAESKQVNTISPVENESSDNKTDIQNEVPAANVEQASPAQEPKRKKRRMTAANIVFRIVLFLIVIILAIWGIKALVSLSINLEPEAVRNASTKEIAINTTGTLAYDRFQRGVLVANGGNVSYYNSDAQVLWEKNAFDGSPVIDVCGKYALVSYTGTPNALLFTGSNAVPVTGNGKIVTACVNENGYFALVMTEEGYKNQIVVFNNKGSVIYRWHSAENYITSVAIAPDNKSMTASTVGFGSNSFASSVLIFDFAQDKPHTGQQEDDNLIMDIEYVSDNRIAVIGDKTTTYYKTNGKKIVDIDYEGKKLTTFDICDDGHTILCFAKDDSFMSNSDVYSYTTRGKQMGHFETNGRALSVSCNDGHILVSRERQFDLLSEKCKKETTMAVVKDIKNSVLFDKGRYAFVVSGNAAQVIKVR